ncbi:hydantoinase B/oxoprolinase family protein [Saccharopolyspora sp. ASAGF58]|uniref:hydantoinase B/oxoprolinase family protein n=1 Tax=Saccharopolyspora sp. ASAGF58 TaxID=2719023 RepID=UPI0014402AAE|nr:hydantoinase B/oxoprolinase family protein [Saccharopolyspora sp. ASAGF58]QIZ38568.1 hydantoinase B/oxoprolinase family protein [Saccharopolyspora sp. ASAGF58]
MSNRAPDPVTCEVVRHGLTAAAEQMAAAVERSARSQVVREMLDYSTGVFDASGGIIAQSTRIPIHLNSMTRPLRRLLELYPLADWRTGDVYITNDPYSGGQHLPDIMTFAPVVVDGECVAIVGTIGHHADVGGRAPASYGADATEVYQEGFQIPPLRIVREGHWNELFLPLFAKNIRLPDTTVGDLKAQIAALGIGAGEVARIVRRYGTADFLAAAVELVAAARRVMTEAIGMLPGGAFRAEDVIDGDGIDDEPVRIVVEIRRSADNRLTVDFTGTDAQVRGPINSPIGATESAVYYGTSAVLQPGATPNCGSYEPIDVIALEGFVLNPRHPAPVVGRSVFTHRIANVVMAALGQALPDRACAHHYGNSNVSILSHRTDSGAARVLFEIGVGGWGGRPGQDGPDGLSQGVHNSRNNPVELVEQEFPCRILRYAYRTDSGGAGRWRGGLGLERRVLVLAECEFSAQFDRMKFGVPGLLGGGEGAPGELELERSGDDVTRIPGKVVGLRLHPGDVLTVRTQGGGGLGDPRERDVAAAATDVRLGKVSRHSLTNDYGMNLEEIE